MPALLHRYEELRRERTAGIQLGSRRNSTLFHLRGPKAWLRNLTMPLAGRAGDRWNSLFDYDAFAAARSG